MSKLKCENARDNMTMPARASFTIWIEYHTDISSSISPKSGMVTFFEPKNHFLASILQEIQLLAKDIENEFNRSKW